MDSAILDTLNQARGDHTPVILVTCLDTGVQSLYTPGARLAGAELPPDLATLARRMLQEDRCGRTRAADHEYFFQPFNSPLRMLIIGAVHITQSLAQLAAQCDYQVTVIDPREAFASSARFPGVDIRAEWPDRAVSQLAPDRRTAVVSLSHDPKIDDPALAAALDSDAFYIGALGSRRTQESRRRRLTERGYSEQQLARIHGPVGLAIGARSPAEIAVSIMAEITSSLRAADTP